MTIDLEHYIKIHKYHEEHRTPTSEREKYWKQYMLALKSQKPSK